MWYWLLIIHVQSFVLWTHPSIQFFYPSIHSSIHLSIYPSIHLSIYPSIHWSIWPWPSTHSSSIYEILSTFSLPTANNMNKYNAEYELFDICPVSKLFKKKNNRYSNSKMASSLTFYSLVLQMKMKVIHMFHNKKDFMIITVLFIKTLGHFILTSSVHWTSKSDLCQRMLPAN